MARWSRGMIFRFGCERSRVQIPDDPTCSFETAILEERPFILPTLAQLHSIVRYLLSFNVDILSFYLVSHLRISLR